MSEASVIRLHDEDGIYTITLNRPEKRNAMNPQLHREMHAALTKLRFDPQVRVLIITGEGESFCAGQDLKEYFYDLSPEAAALEREQSRPFANEWRNTLLRLFHAPTIAAINGWCFGGAFSIVGSCDIAIAAEDAVFGLSEINFKNFPGGLVTKHISELMPQRKALYYALMGEPFDGKKAADIGLITDAVPRAQLWSEVMRIAHALRDKDAHALRTIKETFKIGKQMDYEEAYYWTSAKQNELTLRQRGAWLDEGIGNFMKGNYRPGLGAEDK